MVSISVITAMEISKSQTVEPSVMNSQATSAATQTRQVRVTVDGAGSTWESGTYLEVGPADGILSIKNGGVVNVSGTTWVAPHSGSSGEIHFAGGTLSTYGLVSAIDDLTGTGTINTHGIVSDVDLLFDATHSLSQTLSIGRFGPGYHRPPRRRWFRLNGCRLR